MTSPALKHYGSAEMFELKKLSPEAVPAALEKANRYRLLNEPGAAESIYLDVLSVDPDNQEALRNIILSMSDRFGKDYAVGDARVAEYIMRLHDDYERNYYTGIMYERRAKATLQMRQHAHAELAAGERPTMETDAHLPDTIPGARSARRSGCVS